MTKPQAARLQHLAASRNPVGVLCSGNRKRTARALIELGLVKLVSQHPGGCCSFYAPTEQGRAIAAGSTPKEGT